MFESILLIKATTNWAKFVLCKFLPHDEATLHPLVTIMIDGIVLVKSSGATQLKSERAKMGKPVYCPATWNHASATVN